MIENNSLIPKKIKLIVNKGQDLQLYHPKKTIKRQPQKWRVLFLGVVEKMATAKITSENGNPEWLCEIIVTAKNAHDPIILLVTDSKSRHIGQVVIPLSKVPPQPSECSTGGRPPLVFSNIYKSELEPTKKNSYPKGYLYYWMWTDEYWQFDEIVGLKTKKNLSKSMHDLTNSTLNLFRRKKSTTSIQDFGMPTHNSQEWKTTNGSLKGSPLKINQMKKTLKPGSDSSSSVTSHNAGQSSTMPNSACNDGYFTKNPFDAMMTTDISIENNMRQEEPYQPAGPSNTGSTQNSLHHQISMASRGSPANPKKQGIFAKFKSKKSQSSVDLTKIATEQDPSINFYSGLPQSLGKQQGQRLFEKKNDFSKSSSDMSPWIIGDSPVIINSSDNYNDRLPPNGSRRLNRPHSCLVRNGNDSYLPSRPPINGYLNHNGNHDQTPEFKAISRNTSLHGAADMQLLTKNREDMTKRELIDLSSMFENQIRDMTDRCRITRIEADKLSIEKRKLEEDLSTVKDELCRLKLRLLEAGHTVYLEKTDPKSRAEVLTDLAVWRANSKL